MKNEKRSNLNKNFVPTNRILRTNKTREHDNSLIYNFFASQLIHTMMLLANKLPSNTEGVNEDVPSREPVNEG